MSEASVGQTLREAREAQGMSVEDAAMRLRLMHRQIDAMEADDFESLGQPVFARGFVRNYARLLGLIPERLLARMQGAPAEPSAVTRAEPPLPRSWVSSPWLLLLLLGALLAVAIPVALYFWLNSEPDNGAVRPLSAVTHAPAPAATPPVPTPAAVPTAPPTAEAPAAPAEAAESAATATPSRTAAATAQPAPAAGHGALHLEFGAEAWAEVKDASGRMLLRKLNPAGSSVDLSGEPPFELVIGNAAQAQLTYNGRPIDLKPFIDVAVARFTLEE